jgi:hypothetical protein
MPRLPKNRLLEFDIYSMAVCTELTNAIYVVSFAITGTSMQKVKDEKERKGKRMKHGK